jgi:multidrug efflux pump subunit AcrA (membrane-fusion protein)
MKKGIFWIIVIVIIGIVVFRITQRFKTKESVKSVARAPTEVVIEEVKRGDIAQTLSYTGTIAGKEQVTVYPIEETGRLIKYMVKEGDKVKKGDVIALVDRSIKGMEFKSARVISPISGIVGMLFLDPGSPVAPQIPVAMIANINRVKVKISVVEKDLSRIHKGQLAMLTVDAYPEKKFEGKLTKLSPFVDPMTKASEGEIIAENPGWLLKPGMFVRIKLVTSEHKNVIVVPSKGILKRGEKKLAFIAQRDKTREIEVETGFSEGDKVEVTKGLNEGDKLIVLGNYGLRDGGRIISR